MKRLFCLLAVFCSICICLMPVYAAETAGSVPRVVFENEEKKSPDLYITKHAESAAQGYEVPADVRFAFILRLDGELADRREYRVFDETGTEVLQTVLGVRIPFKTDRYGVFHLRSGQTAMFAYIGQGTCYEVTEAEQEGFRQTEPPGGAPVSGVMTADGASETFTNLYIPDVKNKQTRLEICKTISFPSGYEPPPTPDFYFILKLDGKKYRRESYTVLDSRTGKTLGSGMTDDDGGFALKGGYTAVFTDIPAETDYEITERETPGWRATNGAVRKGAAKAPVTLEIFNNAGASFAVSKRMEDNSRTEEDFVFLLAKADGSIWPGARYYLYYTTGEQIDSGLHETDEDGNFILKPGQAAVFTGAMPGTHYSVSEVGRPDYIQVLPAAAEGYMDKTVTDAVEILPFVNRQAEKGQVLSVTKTVQGAAGELPPPGYRFHFILYKKTGEEKGGYLPVADALYSIETGASQFTYKTDQGGRFSIQANETARFEGLKQGEYKVEELPQEPEYHPLDGEYVRTGVLAEDGLFFTFTNLYVPHPLDLSLLKTDQKDAPLAGAEFILYKDRYLENPANETLARTGEDGKAVFTDVKAGTYYLKETKAPDGCRPAEEPWKIEIWRDSGKLYAAVSTQGSIWTSKDESGRVRILAEEGEKETVCISVYNRRWSVLPSTGGKGIWLFYAAGMACILFSAAMMAREARRRSAEKGEKT